MIFSHNDLPYINTYTCTCIVTQSRHDQAALRGKQMNSLFTDDLEQTEQYLKFVFSFVNYFALLT